MKQGEKMLKKLTQQATDLILHSIASGEVMGANLLITKGNEELVYAQAGMATGKRKNQSNGILFSGYIP